MEAMVILAVALTMGRATTPRARLLCSLFTGVAGTAASAVATAYVVDMVVATADMAVAGAEGSNLLYFKQ